MVKKFFKEQWLKILEATLKQSPTDRDVIFFMALCLAVVFQPFYLNNRINVFELGLYLPGINGILHGGIPYKDFFHLRGPLELYIPAWLMQIFGAHMGVLCFYFFVGNVLCMLVLILIAREFIRSRFIFYMMVPAIIARTYPRVTFAIWGGMRYTFGLMAMYCLIKFFKKGQWAWAAAAGILTALSALTSIEMGVYVGVAALVTLGLCWWKKNLEAKQMVQGALAFSFTVLVGLCLWVFYAMAHGAFLPYIDATWTIVSRMQIVIDPHNVAIYPHNFAEALHSMMHPSSLNFRQMSVAYLYIFLAVYLIGCLYLGRWGITECCLLCLGVFGFIMYNTAFRSIWASQFEMAVMPEKILYFFLAEVFLLWLWNWLKVRWQKIVVGIVLLGLLGLSTGYFLERFFHRFWSGEYIGHVLSGKSTGTLKYWERDVPNYPLDIDRLKGISVPVDQYQDLEELNAFIRQHTDPKDVIVMFPELGGYNFIFDRPFLGRFPITTFSWFNDRWFDEYMRDLKSLKAKYIVVQKTMPDDWYAVYFGYPPNKIKFEQMLSVIHASYVQIGQTDQTLIYQRK